MVDRCLKLLTQAIEKKPDWHSLRHLIRPLDSRMEHTLQNPVFHAEGNVWTHTRMVCEELLQLPGFQALKQQDQLAVFMAALLHDTGKIVTTRMEDGHLVSPNHSSVGAKMVRQYLLQELGLCGTPEKLQLREQICQLVRYHSVPPHVIDHPHGARKLRAIAANSQLCPALTVEQLCLLSRADALGRKCAGKDRMLEQIALGEELARESGCYDGPFPFPSDHTRYCYLSGKDIPPHVELYNNTWGEVILMSGLPGTGKDTWVSKHCPGMPMISLDDIRKERNIQPTDNQGQVADLAKERAKSLLRAKQPFVWNATNLTPMVRGKLMRLFEQYGAACRIVYLETDWEERARRNESRQKPVSEIAVYHMMRDLIPPEASEAHRVQWLCV